MIALLSPHNNVIDHDTGLAGLFAIFENEYGHMELDVLTTSFRDTCYWWVSTRAKPWSEIGGLFLHMKTPSSFDPTMLTHEENIVLSKL